MSEVWRIASNGMLTTKVAALAAQDDFTAIVAARKGVAEGILGAHEHAGHSTITMERSEEGGFGDLDWQVTLNDERGQKAAMTIEFGRKPGGRNGPMEGIHPLGIAFELDREG